LKYGLDYAIGLLRRVYAVFGWRRDRAYPYIGSHSRRIERAPEVFILAPEVFILAPEVFILAPEVFILARPIPGSLHLGIHLLRGESILRTGEIMAAGYGTGASDTVDPLVELLCISIIIAHPPEFALDEIIADLGKTIRV